MKDKVRGWSPVPPFPRDDFDIDYELESKIFKALFPNLKSQSIILTSTPNGKKGFFWDTLQTEGKVE